jgi:outer membrane lipoprotein-sorting protein
MGSEFSYADIAAPHIEDYDFKLLKEQACAPYDCYVIEYKPNKESVSDRTGCAKGIVWVRKDNFMEVVNEIYDLNEKPWKKMEASEIKQVDVKNYKWMAHHLKMTNLNTKRVTEFVFSDVKVNQQMSDSLFTQTNLSKEK